MVQKDWLAYVDLHSLAKIANATLSFKADKIVLSIRAPESDLPAAKASGEPAHSRENDSGLSQDFMRAGIEEIATMREWASTMAYAIQTNYQITDNWAVKYRELAANNLRLASAAASTESDGNALQLLTNEFEAVQEWSNRLVEAKKVHGHGEVRPVAWRVAG